MLLRKGAYPYEYMDSWERFDETSLPDKEAFHSNLNMEDITDIDYKHTEKLFKNFNNKNLGDYHDLYVQNDTLLLADVFQNFRKTCCKVYGLDPAQFLSAPELVWQACLKKTGLKLEVLTDPDMLLMVENGIHGGICHKIIGYVKANNIPKIMIRVKNHHTFNTLMQTIYMAGQCQNHCLLMVLIGLKICLK